MNQFNGSFLHWQERIRNQTLLKKIAYSHNRDKKTKKYAKIFQSMSQQRMKTIYSNVEI